MIRDIGVLNSIVKIDDRTPNRWLDAWGDVRKFISTPGLASDDTTNSPTNFIATATGTSPTTISATENDTLLITTGGTEYNGANVQLRGSTFKLTSGKPLYFGAKVKLSEATQIDFLLGLALLKTDLMKTSAAHGVLATGVEGVFFTKIDESTTINTQSWVAGSQINTATYGTAVGTGYRVYEIYFDGAALYFYIDGVLVTTMTSGLPTVTLTPSINVRAGSAAAVTATIAWMRCLQVNE